MNFSRYSPEYESILLSQIQWHFIEEIIFLKGKYYFWERILNVVTHKDPFHLTTSTDRLCDCITWLVTQFEALRTPSICPVLWYLLASEWNSVTQISPSSERLWPCEICSYSNEKFYLLFWKIRWSMSS